MYDITITREDGTTTTPRELNKERQENILNKMAEVKGPATMKDDLSDPESWSTYLTEEQAQAAKDEVLQFTDGSTSADDVVAEATGESTYNSWFVDQVIRDVTADLVEEKHISTKEAETLLYNGGYHIYTTLDPEIQSIAESVYEDRGV
jgi:penicillin-binding protein 1A